MASRLRSPLVRLVGMCCMCLPGIVTGSIIYEDDAFDSMPAHFGMSWTPPSRAYQAHLQLLPDAKLCTSNEGLIMPNDTLPVVILAERGDCSFELKGTIAMQSYPSVSFLIVYDDMPRSNLVSMRETYDDNGVALGMLFVSHASGMGLLSILQNQTAETMAEGGPVVRLDGLDPFMLQEPTLQDLQAWILIAMGGFFTFITIFGCLLVLVQVGIIPVNGAGHIILNHDAIRHARRLLSEEEVARLKPGGDLYTIIKQHHTQQQQEQQESQLATPAVVDTAPPLHSQSSSGSIEMTTTIQCKAPISDDAIESHEMNTELIQQQVPTFPETEEYHSCAVCLDEFGDESGNPENTSVLLPCLHEFHLECIIPWLTERSATCPLCKFDVLEHITELDAAKKDDSESKAAVAASWMRRQLHRICRFGWEPIEEVSFHGEGVNTLQRGEEHRPQQVVTSMGVHTINNTTGRVNSVGQFDNADGAGFPSGTDLPSERARRYTC